MTTIILDASAAGAWMFPDESDPTVDALLDAVEEGEYDGLVPVHWFRRAASEAGVEILI